jgi:hypothetical protein
VLTGTTMPAIFTEIFLVSSPTTNGTCKAKLHMRSRLLVARNSVKFVSTDLTSPLHSPSPHFEFPICFLRFPPFENS